MKKSSETISKPKLDSSSTPTIRREVRLEETTTSSTTVVRLTACDQMLIKFYLKHIEENLNELSKIQQVLLDKLNLPTETSKSSNLVELAHKLAIGGHKLVFICDTLQRNINNLSLKQALIDTSNSLSSALKIYMIRLKLSPSTSLPSPGSDVGTKETSSSVCLSDSFKNLILDAMTSVFKCADEFKSIILKYYFKSF